MCADKAAFQVAVHAARGDLQDLYHMMSQACWSIGAPSATPM
jgi:hypothetical protein